MYYDKLSDLGIKLTRRNGSEKVFCPLCHDGRKNKRDRSLSVNITTGEYKCHNTGCEFKGNVRSLERKREHKNFKMVKSAELILFNLNTIGEKKHCIITEGEIDCLSSFEAGFGAEQNVESSTGELINDEFSKWCQVSVPNGASMGNQKLDYLDNCAEWLVGIEVFVIATDADAAGEELKLELIRRLGVERCKVISYPIEECVPLEN